MGANSAIQWTDATWTPIRAKVKADAREIAEAKGYTSLLPIIQPGRVGPHCEHVSPGCKYCYSEHGNGRCLPHNGTGLPFDRRARDLVDIFVDENILTQPLRWRKQKKVFVNSQTDTWGDFVPREFVDKLFAVATLCPWHVFQFLTKRASGAREYLADSQTPGRVSAAADAIAVDAEMERVSEQWRMIEGFEGLYEVSSHGLVRSRGERTLAPQPERNGYLKVSLSKDGVVTQAKIHRLVLAAFHRKPLENEEALHRNRIVTDNRIGNLRWGTKAENVQDAMRHGTFRSPMLERSDFSSKQVAEIRSLRASGLKLKAIAMRFGSDIRQIHEICSGRTYKPTTNIWPLPNVWLGISCEDQQRADARIPDLLATPAAVRFVSYEPALGPVDFTHIEFRRATWYSALEDHDGFGLLGAVHPALDWVIVGGESGPGARPFEIKWARDVIRQCREAGVACFVKQLGAKPYSIADHISHRGNSLPLPNGFYRHLNDRKGGNWDEWPADLRVRNFPLELSA